MANTFTKGGKGNIKFTTKHINETALRNLTSELDLINDESIYEFTRGAILAAPGQYWIRPSGTHPGHHPDDEHGAFGNLTHVKRVMTIAVVLADAADFSVDNKDVLFSGLLIHDLGKYGVDGTDEKTDPSHPFYVRRILQIAVVRPCALFSLICGVAETHMGRWGTKKPDTECERIGHYADYIASRATINIPVTVTLL